MGWEAFIAQYAGEAQALAVAPVVVPGSADPNPGRTPDRAEAALYMAGSTRAPAGFAWGLWCGRCDGLAGWITSDEADAWCDAGAVPDPTGTDRHRADVTGRIPERCPGHGGATPADPGRLARISPQALRVMPASELAARVVAVLDRVAQLELNQVDEGDPEHRGLTAELRWLAKHRPDAYDQATEQVELF